MSSTDQKPFHPDELLRVFYLVKWITRICVYVGVTLLIPFDHLVNGLTWDQAVSVHLGGYIIATLAIEFAFGYTFKLRRRSAYPSALLVQLGGANAVQDAAQEAAEMLATLLDADTTVIAVQNDQVLETIAQHGADAAEAKDLMNRHRAFIRESMATGTTRYSSEAGKKVAAVPIVALRGAIGGFLVKSRKRNSLVGDAQLLESLGTALGLSLENLRQTEELKESEQRLRTVVTSAPIMLLVTNRYGVFTLAEGKMLEGFGVSSEDFVGMHIQERFVNRPDITSAFLKALAGESITQTMEVNGVFVEVRIAPYYDERGQVAGIRALAWDVTERETAQRAARDSEARFRALIENASDFIVILSPTGTVEYGSPSLERVLGYSLDEVVGRSVFDFIHPDEVGEMRRTFALRLEAGGVGVLIEFRALHKDGSWRTIEAIGNFTLTGDPLIRGAIFNARDVTERKQAEMAIRESEERFRSLFQSAGDVIYTISLNGTLTSLNPSFELVTGWSIEEWVGKNFAPLLHPDDLPEAVDALMRLANDDAPRVDNFEWRVLKKNGEYMTGEFVVRPIFEKGRLAGVLGIVRDVTERKHVESAIKYLAEHDQLTGLLNRRSFEHRLSDCIAEAKAAEKMLAVLFLDVDCFKSVNDTLGHEEGDRLLQEVAQELRGAVRENDMLARLGGDEFILMLPHVESRRDAEEVAERLLKALRKPRLVGSEEKQVTASIGIAAFPEDGADAETLIRHADAAMYRAKESGRDNYQWWERKTADVRTTERAVR